ncbi:MAG: hypothetical protein WCZ23_10720 [Rhodospirillaceae bacterium]
MTQPSTPFKVGETYTDERGDEWLILVIRDDGANHPVIGIEPWSEGSLRSWTAAGFFDSHHPHDDRNLVPPAADDLMPLAEAIAYLEAIPEPTQNQIVALKILQAGQMALES